MELKCTLSNFSRDPDNLTRVLVSGNARVEALECMIIEASKKYGVIYLEHIASLGSKPASILYKKLSRIAKPLILGRNLKIPLNTFASFLELFYGIQVDAELLASKKPLVLRMLTNAEAKRLYMFLLSRKAFGELKLPKGMYYVHTEGLSTSMVRLITYTLSKHRDDYLFIYMDYSPAVDPSVPRIVTTLETEPPIELHRMTFKKPVKREVKVPATTPAVIPAAKPKKQEPPKKPAVQAPKVDPKVKRILKALKVLASELDLSLIDLALVDEGIEYSNKYAPLVSLGLARREGDYIIGNIAEVVAIALGMHPKDVKDVLMKILEKRIARGIFASMRVVLVRPESRRNLYHVLKVMLALGYRELVFVDPKIEPRAAQRVYNRLVRGKEVLFNAPVYESLIQVPGTKLCFKRSGGYEPKLVDLTRFDNFVFYGENGDFSKEELRRCDAVVTFPGDYTLPTIVAIALWEHKRRSEGISRI